MQQNSMQWAANAVGLSAFLLSLVLLFEAWPDGRIETVARSLPL